jgi:hypothetical protein
MAATQEVNLTLRIEVSTSNQLKSIWLENLATNTTIRFESLEYLVQYLHGFSPNTKGLR